MQPENRRIVDGHFHHVKVVKPRAALGMYLAQVCFQGLITSLGLAISLRMERRRVSGFDIQFLANGLPKFRHQPRITVRMNASRESVIFHDVFDKTISRRYMNNFGASVTEDQNGIVGHSVV